MRRGERIEANKAALSRVVRRMPRDRAERDRLILALIEDGVRQSEVAELCGVTDTAIAFVRAKAKESVADSGVAR